MLEWSPPAFPNGKIVSYIILYTDKLDVDETGWVQVMKNGKCTSHDNSKIVSYIILYTDKLDVDETGWVQVMKNGAQVMISKMCSVKLTIFSYPSL